MTVRTPISHNILNDQPLMVYANSAERMRLHTNGNVSIGTTSAPGRLNVEAAAISGHEILAWFTVAYATDARLQIRNGSATVGAFTPTILGQAGSSAERSLQLAAAAVSDSGPEPLMSFTSRLNTPAVVTNRPLFRWINHNVTMMEMKADGNLGIGTTNPSGRLHVNGTVFVNPSAATIPHSSTPPGVNEQDLGINTTTGQLINLSTSSIHFKDNVEDLEFDREAFLNLRPVNFDWKEYYGGGHDVGMIAQEVAQTFPALASWSHTYTYLDNGDLLRDSLGIPVVDTTQLEVSGVRYHKLPVYLLAIVKDQQIELTELREQLQQLYEQVSGCCVDVSPMPRLNGSDQNIQEKKDGLEEFVLLRNDPNPFNDYSDIKYDYNGCTRCEIIITDMAGRVVKRIVGSGTQGTIRIYSSEIGSGMFVYSLVNDGQVVRSGHLTSSNR